MGRDINYSQLKQMNIFSIFRSEYIISEANFELPIGVSCNYVSLYNCWKMSDSTIPKGNPRIWKFGLVSLSWGTTPVKEASTSCVGQIKSITCIEDRTSVSCMKIAIIAYERQHMAVPIRQQFVRSGYWWLVARLLALSIISS